MVRRLKELEVQLCASYECVPDNLLVGIQRTVVESEMEDLQDHMEACHHLGKKYHTKMKHGAGA